MDWDVITCAHLEEEVGTISGAQAQAGQRDLKAGMPTPALLASRLVLFKIGTAGLWNFPEFHCIEHAENGTALGDLMDGDVGISSLHGNMGWPGHPLALEANSHISCQC